MERLEDVNELLKHLPLDEDDDEYEELEDEEPEIDGDEIVNLIDALKERGVSDKKILDILLRIFED